MTALTTHNAQFPTGNNGLDFPPDLNALNGELEKFGYYDCMYAGIDTPNGYEVGQVALAGTGAVWSISGATNGFAIDSTTGMITISDNSQLTVAEDRVITVQRVIGPITDSVDITIHVVDDTTSVGFFSPTGDDANDGRQPHKPRQTLANSNDYNTRRDKMLFLRGAVFEGTLPLRDDTLYVSFGNPLAASPTIRYTDVTAVTLGLSYDACIQTQRAGDDAKYLGRSNAVIKDFILDGNNIADSLLVGTQVTNYEIKRIHLTNNAETSNSNGIVCRDNAGGGVVRFITTEDDEVFGDAVYMTKQKDNTALYEYGYMWLGSPKSFQADNLQVSDENDATQRNYNVWVHNIHARNNVDGTSTKGAVVIQGTENYLFENSTIEGKYFGFGVSGHKATIRRINMVRGGLPYTNPSYANTWGLGIGAAAESANRISLYDSNVVGFNAEGEPPVKDGLFIGGTYNDDPAADKERYDMEVSYNRVQQCDGFGRDVVNEFWSGFLKNNLADNNVDNTFSENAGTATLGSYQSKTVEQPYIGIFDSESALYVRGGNGAYDGETLTATVQLASGESVVSYQWRLNGVDIDGATTDSYTLPVGTEAQLNERMPQVAPFNAAEISCVVTVENGSSDRDFLYSNYYKTGHENPELLEDIPTFEPVNQPPVANAGPDQSVAAATQFTLDGTGSQDTDGTIVEWRWTQTAGDPVTLDLDDPARPTAKSPSKTTAQRLTFQLITVDDEGAESSPGTVNIDVAAFAVSEMLKLLDTRQWTVVNDGSVQAFEGRSNREAFRFQVTPSDGIQTSAEGYFLFDQPGVHAVEVISTPTSKISSIDDPHMIRGDVIAARIGDLQTDENGNLTLTFVLYVTDDKDGLVMTAKVIEPYQKASYFRKQG